jgi:serine protease Do
MNSKQVCMVVGLGALTAALVAVPGWSARTTRAQNPENNVSIASGDDDGDLQVFVNPGGSWLGARILEVTPDTVKEFKLPAERGVLLGKIVPDSPAAKAGLKEGDVVTEINGQRVEGTQQFRRMIHEIPAGRVVQFTVWRDDRSQTVAVRLGKSEMGQANTFVSPALPGNFSFAVPQIPELGDLFENGMWMSSRTRLGIDGEDVAGDFGNYFGAPEGEGILVRGVFPDTPASKAGLKVGDVITSVNGERVRSVGELREKIAGKQDEKTVKLGLIRNKAPLSLSVDLPAPEEKKEFHSGVHTNI